MGDIMRKYETISIDLKKRIENGEFEETKKLPTGGQLMKEYDASKNTISNAINCWLMMDCYLLFMVVVFTFENQIKELSN